jgi:hypothetical protein
VVVPSRWIKLRLLAGPPVAVSAREKALAEVHAALSTRTVAASRLPPAAPAPPPPLMQQETPLPGMLLPAATETLLQRPELSSSWLQWKGVRAV